MINYQIHPTKWKHEICIVIPKKGNPSYKVPSAYRPISLSCLGKVLESLLSNRVQNAARRICTISPYQMGSIVHNSSTDSLTVRAEVSIRSKTRRRKAQQKHNNTSGGTAIRMFFLLVCSYFRLFSG
jgi:hypothetical protein